MNDNEPFGEAEANLHRFHDERFPDRASAQRTIVRLDIHLKSKRGHLRILLDAYVSMLKWFKPMALTIVFIVAVTFLLGLAEEQGSGSISSPTLGLAFLVSGLLCAMETLIGKPVLRATGWRLELSPAFKRMFRASYHDVPSRRRRGL